MKDQFTARPSTGNFPDIERPNIVKGDTNTQPTETQLTELSDDESHHIDDPPVNEINLTEQRKSDVNQQIKLTSTTTKGGMKRKRQNKLENLDVGAALIRIEENKLEMLEEQQKKSLDADESFLTSLLPHIRTLAPQNKMLLQMEMQKLVYNFAYGQHSGQQQTSTPNQYASNMGTSSTNQNERLPHIRVYSQLTSPQSVEQDYSNPMSIASYVTNFSDENY